jgi:small subunit ribosomal protein S6
MRVYEELFILKPGTPEEEIDAYVGQIKDLIVSGKGTVEKADKWGTRKLAYRVQKFSEGIYILIVFTAPAELVKEVERRMRNTDTVIKFITVRIDERLKKIGKRKLHRDKRAARKPPMPVSVPSAAVPAGPAMPAASANPAEPGTGPTPGAPAPGLPGAALPHPAPAAPHAPGPHPAPAAPHAAGPHAPATSEPKAVE